MIPAAASIFIRKNSCQFLFKQIQLRKGKPQIQLHLFVSHLGERSLLCLNQRINHMAAEGLSLIGEKDRFGISGTGKLLQTDITLANQAADGRIYRLAGKTAKLCQSVLGIRGGFPLIWYGFTEALEDGKCRIREVMGGGVGMVKIGLTAV